MVDRFTLTVPLSISWILPDLLRGSARQYGITVQVKHCGGFLVRHYQVTAEGPADLVEVWKRSLMR